jgi:hypothetical protein
MNAGKTCRLVKNHVTQEYVMTTVFKNYVGKNTTDASILGDQFNIFLNSMGSETKGNEGTTSVVTTNPYVNQIYNVKIETYLSKRIEVIQPDIVAFFYRNI